MKANRKKLMLAMARACMDTEDLQKAAEMPRPKYTVLKESDMIVIAAAVWLWVACKLLTWANRRNTHVA